MADTIIIRVHKHGCSDPCTFHIYVTRCRKLLEHGASPKVCNAQCNDATPLDYAILHDNIELIKLLEHPVRNAFIRFIHLLV